eukprot:scpid62046/ scgid4063/ Ras GTPase-activating protein 1; Ras p21 protein activator; p120GAP
MEFGHGLNPAVAPVSEQQLYTRSIELISERDYSVGVQTEEYITLELGVSKAVQQPNGGVCKEGYLTKKVGHSKKWKEFYFSLKVSERHLLFFESDKSSHPKGLIDLNFCNLYNVHESLHGRSNCFQLVIRSFAEVSSFFLCCQSPEDKENCSSWLRCHADARPVQPLQSPCPQLLSLLFLLELDLVEVQSVVCSAGVQWCWRNSSHSVWCVCVTVTH